MSVSSDPEMKVDHHFAFILQAEADNQQIEIERHFVNFMMACSDLLRVVTSSKQIGVVGPGPYNCKHPLQNLRYN